MSLERTGLMAQLPVLIIGGGGQAARLNELFTVVLDGRNALVLPGVEEALGRPARDFADWAHRAAAAGAWRA
jgi:hypothetical protein